MFGAVADLTGEVWVTQRLSRTRAGRSVSSEHARRPTSERSRTVPETRSSADDELTIALQAAQQGDEAAFSQIYRAVQPGLMRYLATLVGAEAEDVAAETWLQVCRDLHTFQGEVDGFRGWVSTIGRHRALDHLRASGRRPVSAYPLEFLATTAGPDDTAGAASESLSTSAALQLIQTLPADQAEAVLLRAVIGLDAITAGRVLGKRPGAVRMSAHRGLRNLARRLDGEPTDAADVTVTQPDALNGTS